VSINQSKRIYIAPYVAGESEARKCYMLILLYHSTNFSFVEELFGFNDQYFTLPLYVYIISTSSSYWVGFYWSDLPSFDDLCTQTNPNLFSKVLHNPDHVLHRLLPPVAHTSHNRPHAHDRSLPERLTHLTDCNFIIRMLFYQYTDNI